MLATALIVFRETLEAALFVGIVAAATKPIPGRARYLSAGVAAGIAGALLLALAANRIAGMADGLGQDIVNLVVLSVALVMLVWHCVWMSAHGREMATAARQLGRSVAEGRSAPWALVIAVSLAVLREGAETVLFVAGTVRAAGPSTPLAVLFAGTAGIAAGAMVGVVVYLGLSRIPIRQLFGATNLLIAFLAAAIASQLAKTLSQAGFVDRWTAPLWDTSRFLSLDSATGTFLHALVGYDAQPSALQIAFYAAVLALVLAGPKLVQRRAVAT